MNNLPPCKPTNFLTCGNIILMHDGGGDRSETVKALDMIIPAMQERGYQVVPVSELMGKTTRAGDAADQQERALGGDRCELELHAVRLLSAASSSSCSSSATC